MPAGEQAAAQAITDTPILFTAVTDPVAAKLVATADAPGANVTGTSDMNHWSSWQLEEAAIKAHTEPLLTAICSALTEGYLRPLMSDQTKAATFAIIEGQGCIPGFRSLAGTTNPTEAAPGTIRGDLGRDWGTTVQQNIVHGSDSPESAAREIAIWFPGL